MTSEERPDSADRAADDLTRRLGRTPRPSELSEHLDIQLDEVIEAVSERRAVRAAHTRSSDDAADGGRSSSDPTSTDRLAGALATGRGHAAWAERPDEIAHAVADGRMISLCGLPVSHMVGLAEGFAELPEPRKCYDCAQTMSPGP